MNILHVVNIPFVIPYFLGEQLNHFSEKGYREFIACSPSEDLSRYAELYNFSYTEVDITRQISLLKDLKAIWHIRKYIRRNKIDVVVGHTPKGGMCAMIASFLAGTKTRIYFRHGLVYETSRGLKRMVLKTSDRLTSFLATRVVCVSDSVARRSLEDRLNGGRKQTVLGPGTCNGIDIARFDPEAIDVRRREELRTMYGLSDTDWVIGYVGRLVRDKGIQHLVDAFEIVHERYANTKLLLVGMLEQRDALSDDIVRNIERNPDIICTGRIANEDIHMYYALMNLFVLPSYREGFPTSVLEASAMRLPVLTTRATGCVDSILDQQTGLFVSHDPADMAEKMIRLISDPAFRRRLATQGREFVTANFQQSLIWQEIEKLYKA